MNNDSEEKSNSLANVPEVIRPTINTVPTECPACGGPDTGCHLCDGKKRSRIIAR